MNEAKQKAIQDAYGEYFEQCNPDENGWAGYNSYEVIGINIFGSEAECKNLGVWRPLSLQGIEDNRGWIAIERGLPEDAGKYWVVVGGEMLLSNFHSNTNQWYSIENYLRYFPTHYQPIVKPQPPIY